MWPDILISDLKTDCRPVEWRLIEKSIEKAIEKAIEESINIVYRPDSEKFAVEKHNWIKTQNSCICS